MENVFLKILKNSQKNNCAGVSQKVNNAKVFSCELCKTFKIAMKTLLYLCMKPLYEDFNLSCNSGFLSHLLTEQSLSILLNEDYSLCQSPNGKTI